MGHSQGHLEIWDWCSQTNRKDVRANTFLHTFLHVYENIFLSVEDTIRKYLTLYSPQTPKWDNLTDLASTLGWTDLVGQSTADYFEAQWVSKKYLNELIEASTRVNYGQASQTHPSVPSYAHFRLRMSMKSMLWRAHARWLLPARLPLRMEITKYSRNSSSTPAQQFISILPCVFRPLIYTSLTQYHSGP